MDRTGHEVGELRSAGDGRPRKGRIAELHRHLLYREADCLGGRLRQDRIGALAHIDATARHFRTAIGEDAYQRLAGSAAHRIGAGGDAPADQMMALAHRAGLGVALRPAESFGPLFIGLAQPARRPWLLRVRIFLRIIQQADRQGIDAHFIGKLVDRTFDAEGARILSWRPQGTGHHRVHRNDVLARGQIGRGIHDGGDRAQRLDPHAIDRRFVDAAMDNRDELALLRGAEGDGLVRRCPSAIGGEILRPRERERHRALQHFCRHGRYGAMRQGKGLRSEAAANIGRHQMNIFIRKAEPFRIGVGHEVDPLAVLPDGERLAFPLSDQPMRLDRRMVFTRCAIFMLDADRGIGQSFRRVAPFDRHRINRCAFAGLRIIEPGNHRCRFIFYLNERRRRGRLFESLRDYGGDMLAAESDGVRES